MNEFHAMKGEGKPLLVFRRAGHVITLVCYCDESLGILCDGQTIQVYEPGDEEACLVALTVLTGVKRRKPAPESMHIPFSQAFGMPSRN